MFSLSLFGALLLDLASKYYIQITHTETQYLLGDILYIEYITNSGIAFSMPVHGLLLKVITIVLIIGISYYYVYHEPKKLVNKVGYGLLLGGALGNAYERIVHGAVTDFIGVKYFSVFNLADTFICIGVFILIIHNYAKGRTTSN